MDGIEETQRASRARPSVRGFFHLLWTALIFAAFTGCATSAAFAADGAPQAPRMDRPHVLLDSGHTATVNRIVRDSRTGYLFTASDDGTVRIWDGNSGSLRQVIRVSHLPVVSLAVNPAGPEIAAVVSDGGLVFQLSVWNWNTGRRLYTHSLSEIPLFVQYSPKGSFLLYARAHWNSLVFLDSSNGDQLPYLPNGFGIVRFAIVSASERTVMTYSPSSGNLIYWDLQSGTQKAVVSTIPNLSHVTAISDVYVAGNVGTTLEVVNIVNGSVVSQRDLGDVQSISVDRSNDELAALYTLATASPGTEQLSLFSVRDGALSTLYFANSDITGSVTAMLLANGDLLAARPGGTIDRFSQYVTGSMPFGPNVIVPVTDIAFSDDRFFATTASNVISVRSDFFSGGTQLDKVSLLVEDAIQNPFGVQSGLLSLSNRRLFLYRQDNEVGDLRSINPYNLSVVDAFSQFDSPILQLEDAGSDLLSLERNGRIRLLNSYSFATDFSFTSSGTQTAAYTTNYGVILGRSNSNVLDSALIRVSPQTGETVPVDSNDFLVFDLAFDHRTGSLYSLGLRHSSTGEATELTRYTGSDFSQSRVISRFDGEDLQASVAFNGESGRLFTTLGFDRVQMWDGSSMRALEATGHIPRKVTSWRGRVYAVNRDGSVSVWDSNSLRHLFDFYVLPDGSWTIITPDGYYLPSTTGNPEQHLSLVAAGNNRNLSLSDFQLKLASGTGL
ncbi:WD40 repeat domain-containing protein [Salinispira pacifica]